MGWKVGITCLKLTNQRSKKSKAKRTGYLRAVVCEGLSERWGRDEDIDRSRSHYNTYTGVTSGVALAETMTAEAADYSKRRKAVGGRALRADAAIGWAMIVKPPAEIINAMSAEQQVKFFSDSDRILMAMMGADNIRATALHRDEQALHKHYFGMGYTCSGELSVDKVINPRLYKRLNQEYPEKMREFGWDIDDCTVYDSEKVKGMTENEAAAYKAKCRAKRREKKSGLDSKAYKEKRELEKLQKEQEKAKLGRDLALAAQRQVKQLTAATREQKDRIDREIAGLQEQAAAYPADLHERLDALAVAIAAYRSAAGMNEGGPLVEFLKTINITEQKDDGSTIQQSIYDWWQEYYQDQERQLQAQADRARQSAIEVQQRLPTLSSPITQHSNSYDLER